MLTGAIIGAIAAAVGLLRAFPKRHEPEPPNSRWKLPLLVFIVAICLVFMIFGPWPVFWAILAGLFLVEVGFVLAGRNPWWMQGNLDRRLKHQDVSCIDDAGMTPE